MLTGATFVVLLTVLGSIPVTTAPAGSKKATYLTNKGTRIRGQRPARGGQRAQRPIYAHYWWTQETMPLEGPGIRQAACDAFFQCHFTRERADIPPELVTVILDAARTFKRRSVKIVSAYRHPKYNLWLRKKGREVASKSKHTEGQAIDFQLPGVPIKKLYRYLLKTHDGGVGFYRSSEFVHVDTGDKRTWKGT